MGANSIHVAPGVFAALPGISVVGLNSTTCFRMGRFLLCNEFRNESMPGNDPVTNWQASRLFRLLVASGRNADVSAVPGRFRPVTMPGLWLVVGGYNKVQLANHSPLLASISAKRFQLV